MTRRNPRRACVRKSVKDTEDNADFNNGTNDESNLTKDCTAGRNVANIDDENEISPVRAPSPTPSRRRATKKRRLAKDDDKDDNFTVEGERSDEDYEDDEDEIDNKNDYVTDDDEDFVTEENKKRKKRGKRAKAVKAKSTTENGGKVKRKMGKKDLEKDTSKEMVNVVGLTPIQVTLLDELFAELDRDNKGRVTALDLRRVADDHGVDFTDDEATNMIRFWGSLATGVDREALTKIAVESKFIKV